jgi:hypothetical protein
MSPQARACAKLESSPHRLHVFCQTLASLPAAPLQPAELEKVFHSAWPIQPAAVNVASKSAQGRLEKKMHPMFLLTSLALQLSGMNLQQEFTGPVAVGLGDSPIVAGAQDRVAGLLAESGPVVSETGAAENATAPAGSPFGY